MQRAAEVPVQHVAKAVHDEAVLLVQVFRVDAILCDRHEGAVKADIDGAVDLEDTQHALVADGHGVFQ